MLGIGWQRRPERRWVASLLADEQAIRPLLKYLMTTEVGGREGETERAAEWGQEWTKKGRCYLIAGNPKIRVRTRRAHSPKAES